MLPSGTAELEAENENTSGDPAAGSCVEKLNMPGVVIKPVLETNPVPVTKTKPSVPAVPPWLVIVEAVRSNWNPSTDQKLFIAPELNDHGEAKAVPSPTATNVAKVPSRLCTCGAPTIGVVDPPLQPFEITIVALAAEEVSNWTPPPHVMLPVMAWA